MPLVYSPRNLRAIRREAGVSQMDLAIRAGIHIDQVRRAEQGKHKPGVDTVAKLAAALNVPMERLFETHEAVPA